MSRHGSELNDGLCKTIAALTGHYSVKRLGNIRQLGLTNQQQQTRLDHTLESISIANGMLALTSKLTKEEQRHVLAAIAIEDIGRAPFSNSLESIFTSIPGASSGKAIDVRRTCAVVKHLESKESFLAKNQLEVDVLLDLIHSKTTAVNRSVGPLINGPLDVDRLQYVRADARVAGLAAVELDSLSRGIVRDSEAPVTVLDYAYLDEFLDFSSRRAQLHNVVYFDAVKRGMEHIVQLLISQLWNFISNHSDGWHGYEEPKTVEDFLSWDDHKVLLLLNNNEGWRHTPTGLQILRRRICDGALSVAKVGSERILVDPSHSICRQIDDLKSSLVGLELCWVLESAICLQVIDPASLIIKRRGRHISIDNCFEVRNRPEFTFSSRIPMLLVFENEKFPLIQSKLKGAELLFESVRRLDVVQNLLAEKLTIVGLNQG